MAPKYLAVLAMLNLALFSFIPATNAATCPSLSGCLGIAGLANVNFGSQSSSQCCSLLAGLANTEAAACLCTSLKNTTMSALGLLGPFLGLLGPLLGPLTPLLGGLGPLTSQQFLAVFNACGMTSTTAFTCA